MKSIIFNTEEVKAILDRKKTQKRIICVPNEKIPEGKYEMRKDPVYNKWVMGDASCIMMGFFTTAHGWVDEALGKCPYGKVGDRLWVRETWADVNGTGIETIDGNEATHIYKAEEPWGDVWKEEWDGKWKPSVHMPRWASRITLEITNIRVERDEKKIWEWLIDFKVVKL